MNKTIRFDGLIYNLDIYYYNNSNSINISIYDKHHKYICMIDKIPNNILLTTEQLYEIIINKDVLYIKHMKLIIKLRYIDDYMEYVYKLKYKLFKISNIDYYNKLPLGYKIINPYYFNITFATDKCLYGCVCNNTTKEIIIPEFMKNINIKWYRININIDNYNGEIIDNYIQKILIKSGDYEIRRSGIHMNDIWIPYKDEPATISIIDQNMCADKIKKYVTYNCKIDGYMV